jgi:4-hydroxy-3-polyprenylbenzoate decarboxylase
MNRRVGPAHVSKAQAPINEIVLRGDDIDLTKFPAPRFWPGDGGRYIGTGDITLTASPDTGRINVGCYRQMLHGPRRAGLYCSPGKHGLLDREAWWKRGKPCEVVVAYGIDPVLFMLAA